MTILSFEDLLSKGKVFLNLLIALPLERLARVKKNRIICWSFQQQKYACNPRAITDYLLTNHPGEFEIYWAFEKGIDVTCVDPRVRIVFKNSFAYAWALGSSHFVINNSRSCIYDDFFVKKKGQVYIMTWHGSLGTKPCEKDAEQVLSKKYVEYAKRDSRMCDLLVSGNDFLTNLYRRAFWYDGEVLEKCYPRNDIYYDKVRIQNNKEKICRYYNIPQDHAILLYAPTFRSGLQTDVYKINWSNVVKSFEDRFNTLVSLIVKLHPNYIGYYHKGELFSGTNVIDAIDYPDLSDLVCAADYMISDYSSSIFDMAYMFKPCFIYAPDHVTYDRGYYFKLNDLPFPFAVSEEELNGIILNFDEDNYHRTLSNFFDNIGMKEDGCGAKRLYDWMCAH